MTSNSTPTKLFDVWHERIQACISELDRQNEIIAEHVPDADGKFVINVTPEKMITSDQFEKLSQLREKYLSEHGRDPRD